MDERSRAQGVTVVGQTGATAAGRHEVAITDVQIPFFSLVVILVKVALAAIPAALVLWLIGAVVMALLASK